MKRSIGCDWQVASTMDDFCQNLTDIGCNCLVAHTLTFAVTLDHQIETSELLRHYGLGLVLVSLHPADGWTSLFSTQWKTCVAVFDIGLRE